jgi:exonuclease VII small subunit
VAVKDVYDTALAAFNEGEALGSASQAAEGKYLEAEQGFTSAYNRARDLRSAAQDELNKAKQEIKNVEDDAVELEDSRRAAEDLEE